MKWKRLELGSVVEAKSGERRSTKPHYALHLEADIVDDEPKGKPTSKEFSTRSDQKGVGKLRIRRLG